MSAVERIRRQALDVAASSGGSIGEDEIEALCDLADAFRNRERTPSYTVNCDCADCVVYRRKIMDAHKRMRDALARLDGEVA